MHPTIPLFSNSLRLMPHLGQVSALLPKSSSAILAKLLAISSKGEKAAPRSSSGFLRNLSYPSSFTQFSQYMTPFILMILLVTSAPHLAHFILVFSFM